MSDASKIIEGLPDEARMRINPQFDPTRAASAEDAYILSRIDGLTPLRELCMIVGFERERTMAALVRLRALAAILVGDETPGDVRPEPKSAVISEGDQALLEADSPVSAAVRAHGIELNRVLAEGTLYELLGVAEDVGRRDLKRAYFRLSKEFHPDRFYGMDTGDFGDILSTVHEGITKGFNILSDRRAREKYDASLRGETAAGPQTKEEHAAELYERASLLEAQGQLLNALKLFRGACRLVENARYLRRTATCALAATELAIAEEYASKAVQLKSDDPSYLRVLADVLVAVRRYSDAEQVLSNAVGMRTENDKLMADLRGDLERVRQLLQSG